MCCAKQNASRTIMLVSLRARWWGVEFGMSKNGRWMGLDVVRAGPRRNSGCVKSLLQIITRLRPVVTRVAARNARDNRPRDPLQASKGPAAARASCGRNLQWNLHPRRLQQQKHTLQRVRRGNDSATTARCMPHLPKLHLRISPHRTLLQPQQRSRLSRMSRLLQQALWRACWRSRG